jgi:hemoglobin
MPESLYEAIGGAATCHSLAVTFYARVAQDPLLRPLFPGKTMTCAIEEFSAYMSQFLGGRPEDTQRRWWLSLGESHSRFRITPELRSAWMANMIHVLDDAPLAETERGILRRFFEDASNYVVNTPRSGKVPDGAGLDPEIADRWRIQLAL